MFNKQDQIAAGVTVFDASGEKVGTVHENNAEGGYLVVEKGWLFPKDFYVPMSAVARLDADGVFLRIGADELGTTQYDEPPVARDPRVDASRDDITSTTAHSVELAAGDIRVPVREEELVVGKQMQEEGRVHIHKEVTTERQTVSVPLRQERVTIERVPLSADTPVADDAFVERDFEVPVMGEEAVVGKRVTGVEEVIIHKDVTRTQEQVADTVRKERVVVDGVDADGQATSRGSETAPEIGTSQHLGGTGKVGTAEAKGMAQTVADDLGQAKDKLTGQ